LRARRRPAVLAAGGRRLPALPLSARGGLDLRRGGVRGGSLVARLLGDDRAQHDRALRQLRAAHLDGTSRPPQRPVDPIRARAPRPVVDGGEPRRAALDRGVDRPLRPAPEPGGRVHVRWRPRARLRLVVPLDALEVQRAAGARRLNARRATPRVVVRRDVPGYTSGQSRIGGTLMQDQTSARTPRNLDQAVVRFAGDSGDGMQLTGGTVEGYRGIQVDFDKLVTLACEGMGLPAKDVQRTKNFFALGFVFWLYSRDTAREESSIRERFAKRPDLAEANRRAFKAGYYYGETTEAADAPYQIAPARLQPGTYRNVMGSTALALGLIAAARQSGLRLFFGSYPITPASDVLHELAKHRQFGVTTFQAEDEIAAVTAAIGASFGGALGATASSGPGVALKTEAIGLALMIELPLVIVVAQRGGPSTGLPTKTEQSDLFQAVYGRNGESPVPVLATRSPADCFDACIEASRIAIEYRTPVILLSDGAIGTGSEPWKL